MVMSRCYCGSERDALRNPLQLRKLPFQHNLNHWQECGFSYLISGCKFLSAQSTAPRGEALPASADGQWVQLFRFKSQLVVDRRGAVPSLTRRPRAITPTRSRVQVPSPLAVTITGMRTLLRLVSR
eukprot:3122410-Rhodomonas_salina.3